MTSRSYTVTCLSGDGIGPEMMAEASRALAAVSQLHAFEILEVHAPFGGDAVRRFGHSLPPETRAACRRADAVLVASTKEPALEGVKAELDLTWRITRVRHAPEGDLALVSPLVDEAVPWTVNRAFEIARARRAHIVSVGGGPVWRRLVEHTADRNDGVAVEHLSLEAALPVLAHSPGRVDVVVTERVFAEALSNMVGFAGDQATRVVASGRLAEDGTGVFGPTHGSAIDIAGQGVANPSAMVLAAALMLAESFGKRAAARTLEGAVAGALAAGARTADMVEAGTAVTTRQFMDVLLAELPGARTDMEFVR